MTTEPKKPATPVADAIDAAMPDTRPGHDVTDGATGKPYSQAGEKSAGQLAYEKEAGQLDKVPNPSGVQPCVPWASLSPKDQKRWEWNATATPKNQTIKAP